MARTILAFLALTCVVQSASAVDVYTCTGPNGEKVFQNTPCAGVKAKDAALYGSYRKQPDAPSKQDVAPDATEWQGQQPTQEESAAPQPQPPVYAGSDDVKERSPQGYVCNDGTRRWMQSEPCPTSVTRKKWVNVIGTDVRTGKPVNGVANVPYQTPVNEKGLDRDALCAELNARTSTARGKQSDADAAYERNKLRRANGCGG